MSVSHVDVKFVCHSDSLYHLGGLDNKMHSLMFTAPYSLVLLIDLQFNRGRAYPEQMIHSKTEVIFQLLGLYKGLLQTAL